MAVPRGTSGPLLADNVEVRLASLDVRRHRLLHLLHAHQQPQVLCMEQGTGEKFILKCLQINLIQNSWQLLHFFLNQAKSEDREYSHTGLVFAAILAISSLIPIAGGAILHVVRRSAIHLICPFCL